MFWRWRHICNIESGKNVSWVRPHKMAQVAGTYLDVDAPGLEADWGWHVSRCCFHVLMAAALSSVRIGIHFSQVRHCTLELSNRFTLGSAENAALRSSTGWAFFALQQHTTNMSTPQHEACEPLHTRHGGMDGGTGRDTYTRFARQLLRCASHGMEQ